MDEKEAEARPVMGTIFLVYVYIVTPTMIVYPCCASFDDYLQPPLPVI